MTTVSIIDYGIGNLLSVVRAFEYFQVKVRIAETPEDILAAERLVLPGVGAFADGMKGLADLSFIEPIKRFVQQGKPFLGICLGMQMMLSHSNEFGNQTGLDLIQGNVIPIPPCDPQGVPHKIPHIGWNKLFATEQGSAWEQTILKNIEKEAAVYFVHSYMAVPQCPSKRLADTFYNGQAISAVIHHENIYGCQFHPEKSGVIGLRIIEQFMEL
ncbi:imidazole glycerol phosphate synthase subunit HisH [Fluoribacter dumoffii]|uniref:Imidazole glycerol phosphate synthase subunit HisH n=1 Tax=Fluoribacter dumoffii TaxID=463 RepID=A0A377G5M9_9GAMM|nr:imidazole glycerol phosphate synthase subunit HisH [Fluoribacter dumoffii]KTC91650.1 imidazole glycerol phosphate synthase subunit HisH [Fluoribacter dumoffii NY 23]MCW8387225.1 imidazole glycerol phosphate synthase subunit HisH [Fluoribacter dumoffii]MCW8417269.1 imidazole glycerol phosphate synthase subunit HisH [Fluoribacter dumoffii]MCW8454890.1 imidazole glycerol phosphate synthase subunit HisH [Fluoribacter dumoffii]MCW8461033.1 imidazole glycerol phosphate synthase subunit HisH [Fluo